MKWAGVVIAIGVGMVGITTAGADLVPVPPDSEATKAAADLVAIQGVWTREMKNAQGAVFRVEKRVEGKRETLVMIDSNGNTAYAQTNKFELTLENGIRRFTFRDLVVTAGPDQGGKRPGPESFQYRLEGDTLYEVWGLIEGDRRPLALIVWQRPKK